MGQRAPGGARTKQQVRVPIPSLVLLQVANEPITGDILPIPEMNHTVIHQPSGIPLGAGIEEQFICPEGVDVQGRATMLRQNLVLHPTGACPAGRSSGGEDKEQSRAAFVSVKHGLKLVDTLEVSERDARRRVLVGDQEPPPGSKGPDEQQDDKAGDPVAPLQFQTPYQCSR